MTLIVGVPAQDGVVLGSDGQVTAGTVRTTADKIFRLNDHAVWAAAGELALIQRVAERIEGFPGRNQPLATMRDVLGTFVKDTVQALLNVDFRTQFFAQNPQLTHTPLGDISSNCHDASNLAGRAPDNSR